MRTLIRSHNRLYRPQACTQAYVNWTRAVLCCFLRPTYAVASETSTFDHWHPSKLCLLILEALHALPPTCLHPPSIDPFPSMAKSLLSLQPNPYGRRRTDRPRHVGRRHKHAPLRKSRRTRRARPLASLDHVYVGKEFYCI